MTLDGPRRMLRPSELEPVHLDLRRIFWAGIALWVVVLVVALVLWAAGTIDWRVPAISGAGIALGLLALLWERRHEE